MKDFGFTKAPPGKYRVIEIDENEQRFSIFEPDFTEIVKDCDVLSEAEEQMRQVIRTNILRLIYNSEGDCVGQFRLGKVTH